MRITIIGTGYVGLVTGTCLSDLGNEIMCLDIDEEKIKKLEEGIIPIYEPGLSDLVKRNVRENRLFFTIDPKKAMEFGNVIFIAVGTPSDDNGCVDMKYIKSAAESIGKNIDGYKVIVDKSTVPVGTADLVKEIISKNTSHGFDVVSNPEFLREGSAVKDFQNPDRIIIGTDSQKARDITHRLYKSLERVGQPIMFCDQKSAEMIKYAANAMLATRISFMNEMARLCEKVGADVKTVAKGIGLDKRIGPKFLQAGVGYGGSCFPKDVKGLFNTAKEYGVDLKVLKAVDEVNEEQKKSLLPKIKRLISNLKEKKIAIWGISFKPKTDDIREAPALVIIKQLLDEGAKVVAFDPEAEENTKKIFPNIIYAKNPMDAIQDADCLVVVTEWDEFRDLDKEKIKSLLKSPNIVDGRNIYDPKEMKDLGFNYIGVGR